MSSIELKPLEDQIIVITGASSGIGLATADLAAQNGARIVLNARSEDTLQDIVDEINANGGEAIFVAGDVANREDVERLAQAAITRFGRIDTWINNAGVSIYGRLEETDETDARRLFDVNFWGVVHGSLTALPHLKAQGGALINIGSEVSDAVVPLQGMYSASKHAVKGFTDALRVELHEIDDAQVAVTLIQPSATNTPYPEHARNYMEAEPALPTPQDDPYKVAEKILKAATHETRAVKIGMSKLNTLIAKLAPALGDKMAPKFVKEQKRDEAPRDPLGTLYKPGRSGRVYGEGPAK